MEARSDPIARFGIELKVLQTKPDFSSDDLDRICDGLVEEIVTGDSQNRFVELVVPTNILYIEGDTPNTPDFHRLVNELAKKKYTGRSPNTKTRSLSPSWAESAE